MICFRLVFLAFSCGTQHSNLQFRFCDTIVLINHGPHPFHSIRDSCENQSQKSIIKPSLFFPPCNHLTKENISDWFKIVLRNCILSEENPMHFHIKLILSLRKMESQSLFMQKVLTIFSSAINALAHLGRERIFSFFLAIAQGLENLDLHVLSQNTLQDWKGWNIPKHTIYHTGAVWTVHAMSTAKELIWF